MSLLDALLLEPYREPREIWIALRTDSQRGSGTVDDPYDGSVKTVPLFSLSSLTWNVAQHREAIATAPVSLQGLLANGDVVLISGVTGQGAAVWNGTYPVFDVGANTFKYWMAQEPQAPPGKTDQILVARVVYQFDERMRQLGEQLGSNMRIRLGPGTFDTRGYSDAALNAQPGRVWTLKPGMKIRGAGMGATVVRLAFTDIPHAHFVAFGGPYTPPASGVEISDLTVDCNLPAQPPTRGADIAQVACGAVHAFGSDIHLRRVRAIRFGTQTLAAECFVLGTALAGSEPANCVVEDCVVEQPAENNLRETTCVGMAATERPSDGVMHFHRACVIRHCYVNCEYGGGVTSNAVGIESLTHVPGTARQFKLVTKKPHHRTVGTNVVLNVVVLDGQSYNVFNGSQQVDSSPPPTERELHFTLSSAVPPGMVDWHEGAIIKVDWAYTGVPFQALGVDGGIAAVAEGNRVFSCRVGYYHDTFSTRDALVRNNYFSDVVAAVYQFLVGVSSTGDTIPLAALECDDTEELAPTLALHPFAAYEDSVVIAQTRADRPPHGLRTGDEVALTGVSGPDAALYGGVRTVVAVPSPRSFHYRAGGTITSKPANGAYVTVEEGAGGRKLAAQRPLKSLRYEWVAGKHLATAETSYVAHALAAGDGVRITKAGHFDRGQYPASTTYNGFFTVTGVPDATHFQYELPGDPGADSSDADFAPGYFGRLWQVGRFTVENNVMELPLSVTPWGPPVGVALGSGQIMPQQELPPYVFRQAVIRGNVIRHVHTASDATHLALGVDLVLADNSLVESNVVRLDASAVIRKHTCGRIRFSNNRTPAGILLPGYDRSSEPWVVQPELATAIEETMLVALLK